MSPEQPALVAEPAAVRRRIISAPQRTKTPVALIIRERGSLPALEEKLQAARPVVVFPSLSHFCTDSQRSERWAGVIIARACAWDARLDEYVLDRACMALYGDDEGYGWPESVPRLREEGGVDTWLGELDQPRVRTPVARPKKKRVTSENHAGAANGTRKQRVVFSLWDESRAKVVTDDAKSEPAQPAAPSQPAPVAKSAASEPAPVAVARRGRPKAQSAQQSLPFPEADARNDKNDARRRALAVSIVRERIAASKASLSKKEELVARVGAELGLSRARELLRQLRTRAREIASR